MPPQAYQDAAAAVYEPQKAAEATALGATRDTTKNSLEAEKGQVGTDYQSAIDQLTQSVQDQTGQINQLYSQRLGGNFSGLQGNDLGQMFSRANSDQSIIEQTRANKLGEITAGETNADIDYGAGIAALTPKYQSLETQYAQSAYGEDQKAAQAQANSDRSYNLAATKVGNSQASQFKVSGKSVNGTSSNSNGYAFTGPNGKPVNMAEYIQGAGMGGQDIIDLLTNGSSYDRSVINKINSSAAGKAAIQNEDGDALVSLVKKYDTGNYYGFQ